MILQTPVKFCALCVGHADLLRFFRDLIPHVLNEADAVVGTELVEGGYAANHMQSLARGRRDD